jgi:CubicO group peptidase (beta-lactamase class C family)
VQELPESTELGDVLRRGIRGSVADQDGVTPGGVLAFGEAGRVVATIPFGFSHFGPQDEDFEVFEVGADTVYDLASLTKPMATAAALMKLDIDLDAPVLPLVPELRSELGNDAGRVTFAQLLGHASGLPAHLEFFHRLRAGERAGAQSRREALLRMAASTPLAYATGQSTVYSDLGYIVLGFAIERVTGMRLDHACDALVTGPLGMRHTFFVDLDAPGRAPVPPGQPVRTPGGLPVRIAPTEVCPYRGLVHGEVHDDNAHAGGGIFGHAGLFGPAGDVARFAAAMVQAAAGQPVAGFAPDVVRRFFATRAAPDTTWRLGWDTPSTTPGVSHAGDAWPRTGVGHLGFTGTSMWLDPERGRFAVLLTNRVHPSRAHTGIREFRRAVMDAVVRYLDQRA